jgi:hypothetical protein
MGLPLFSTMDLFLRAPSRTPDMPFLPANNWKFWLSWMVGCQRRQQDHGPAVFENVIELHQNALERQSS